MKEFPRRLSETLKANQISQTEFAKRLNVSQAMVNRYCLGKKKPSVDVLFLICKELDESADYLMGLTDL